jgi:cyclopropane fatty-acyl-phospholipid synthase-like methyltransferase
MSDYSPETITQFFDTMGMAEFERFDSSPVQRIKYELHLRCLQQYVPRGARVLEIGAGPGRFTEALAERDCRVVVNDLSPVQLELNEKRARAHGYSGAVDRWLQADVCDLGALDGESFDAIVAFGGPFSYVFERRDEALAQCLALLDERGTLLLSVMSLWGTAHAFLQAVLSQSPELQAAVIRTGDITPSTSPESAHHCHMFRPQELVTFLTDGGLEVVHLAASNALTTRWDDELVILQEDPDAWERILDFEEDATRQPGNVGMGTHMIAVARRPATRTAV